MIYFIGYSYKSNDDPFPKFGNRVIDIEAECLENEWKEVLDGNTWRLENRINSLGSNTHSFEIISISRID